MPQLMLDIERRQDTAGRARTLGATWVSAGLHVSAALLAGFIAAPRTVGEPATTAVRKDPPVIWLARAGEIGGGGRYGNQTPERVSRAHRPGRDRATVPARASAVARRPARNTPPALQEIDIPALPEASGLREMPGVVSTVSVAAIFPSGPGSRRGAGAGDGDGLERGTGKNWGGGPPGGGSDGTPPELIRQVRPNYTSSALQARLRGLVVMDAVVLPDGSVGDVQIVRSLDQQFGLDHEAIKAVKQWRFRPGTRAGNPIAMLVSVEMLFELR